MRKILNTTLLVLCLLLFWLSGISFGSPATYQITEAELSQLELNLETQETLLKQALGMQEMQSEELRGLRGELEAALIELTESKNEIQRLRIDLQRASDSITRANQLFEQFAKEERQARSRLTRQRNLYLVLGLLASGFAISK